jgi:hypothetical protein
MARIFVDPAAALGFSSRFQLPTVAYGQTAALAKNF